MSDLGALGFGQHASINNSSEILLNPLDSNFNSHAELLSNGQVVSLPGLGGSFTFGATIANTEEVAGLAGLANGSNGHIVTPSGVTIVIQ